MKYVTKEWLKEQGACEMAIETFKWCFHPEFEEGRSRHNYVALPVVKRCLNYLPESLSHGNTTVTEENLIQWRTWLDDHEKYLPDDEPKPGLEEKIRAAFKDGWLPELVPAIVAVLRTIPELGLKPKEMTNEEIAKAAVKQVGIWDGHDFRCLPWELHKIRKPDEKEIMDRYIFSEEFCRAFWGERTTGHYVDIVPPVNPPIVSKVTVAPLWKIRRAEMSLAENPYAFIKGFLKEGK